MLFMKRRRKWEKKNKRSMKQRVFLGHPERGIPVSMKYDPGTEFNEVLKHDFYEEIYVLSGTLIDLGKNLKLKESYYGYRHPGMDHWHYISPDGMMTLEIGEYRK